MFRQERALFCLLIVGELKLEVILLIPDNLYLEEVKNLMVVSLSLMVSRLMPFFLPLGRSFNLIILL